MNWKEYFRGITNQIKLKSKDKFGNEKEIYNILELCSIFELLDEKLVNMSYDKLTHEMQTVYSRGGGNILGPKTQFIAGGNGGNVAKTLGGLGVWVLIDLIMIIVGSFTDSDGNKLSLN